VNAEREHAEAQRRGVLETAACSEIADREDWPDYDRDGEAWLGGFDEVGLDDQREAGWDDDREEEP
jgi:hypothetical protein